MLLLGVLMLYHYIQTILSWNAKLYNYNNRDHLTLKIYNEK